MLAIYGCLFALISSGFSLPGGLRWDLYHTTRFSARGNNYGASSGFKTADIKDYPYLASITYEAQLFPAGAGALLNKRWILSSAYAARSDPDDLKIYIETNNAGRSGQRMNVSMIINHEKYNLYHPFDYNIALVKTEKPMTFSDKAKPVKLAKSIPKAGTNVSLLGYGYVQDRPFVGWDLGVATVEVKPKNYCQQQHDTLKTAFCAEADGVAPCYGDFGDLMMYKNKLVGVYIVGDFCKQLNISEVYTNVPPFKKWIWDTIKRNSNDDEMEGLFENDFSDD